MKKIILYLFAILFFAKTAVAVNLAEALASAYQYNPSLDAARENLKTDDEQIFQAISGFLPTINYTASKNYNRKDTASTTGFSRNSDGGWNYVNDVQKQDPWVTTKSKNSSFNIQQNLFNGGKSILALKYAKFFVEASRQDLVKTEQDILLNSVNSFLEVLLRKKIVNICKDNVTSFEKRYKAVEERLNFGAAKKSELASASAALEDAKATLTKAEGDVLSALATFKQLTQTDADDLSEIGTDELGKLPKTQQEVLSIALRNNPDLKKGNFQRLQTELSVKMSAAEFLPIINLKGSASKSWSYTRNNTSGYNPYVNSKTFELEVTIPIYSKGIEYSKTRAAVAESTKFKYNLKNIKNDINRQVVQAWSEHNTAMEAKKSTLEAVKAAQVALDAKQQEYDEGVETLSELLKAQKEFFDYQQNYFSNEKSYGLSRYKVLQVAGLLNARDLNLPTKIYSPTVNYDRVNFKLFGF